MTELFLPLPVLSHHQTLHLVRTILQVFANNTLVLHSTQKTINDLAEKVITFYGTNNAISYGNISM